ncbi:phosphoribosylpyrophosphate synthetase [Sediminibacterium roseum]|uniref:Phosphoribosylpyrophosphate synthetase n=1 Tax=Sediminibacterium roseum TaxID=1978412 RepID=A0ABW9ZUK1_9BACT|nr:phosphoribosylpyrophosphate synthetase [Sediminibacterium roseum]NCI50160.1 phosphoribosylpyrophosphate synthetase [Sediminibacterium roseum]
MHVYENLVDALKDLKNRGFTTDFNIAFDNIQCQASGVCLSPSQFEIVEHYRFEGETNPSDSSVIYAVQSLDGSMKGTLISAYGVYSDAVSEQMIQKLYVHES